MARESRLVVYAALVGNVLVAATKASAAWWTGSSSMLSEALHSVIDSTNELLLLYGMHRSAQRPDPTHPLGYGRELYFWSFIVALLIFALGAAASVWQGVSHLLAPEPINDPLVNYAVLGAAMLFEGGSWLFSLRQFNEAKGGLGMYEAFRRSKDPPTFMVLFEDSAALLGLALAALGTFGATALGLAWADGSASILIGVVLGATSLLLARESKSLLIGERADKALSDSILRIAGGERGVKNANGVMTVHLAPDQILAALSLDFADSLRAGDVEAAVCAIEQKVRDAHPDVVTLFVKPQTDRVFRAARRRRFGLVSPGSE